MAFKGRFSRCATDMNDITITRKYLYYFLYSEVVFNVCAVILLKVDYIFLHIKQYKVGHCISLDKIGHDERAKGKL